MRFSLAWALAALWPLHAPAQAGESCPDTRQEIDTDRPDVTNSSLVVPTGSLQAENGITWTGGRGAALDGPDSRVRLGLAPCTEILVDLPDYSRPLSRAGAEGVSDIAPGIKRQIEALPDGMAASAVAGLLLPTGSTRISGRGYGAYIQVPWSQEIAEDWKIEAMPTTFWLPGRGNRLAEEATLSLAREAGPDADVFFEYVGDHRPHEGLRSSLNFGGGYRITRTQQVDVHVGYDLSTPGPFFGIGYSLRFDDLF